MLNFLVDFMMSLISYLSHGVEVDYFKTDNLYRKGTKLLCIASNGIGGDASFDRKDLDLLLKPLRN
jgi:hypothetical protein